MNKKQKLQELLGRLDSLQGKKALPAEEIGNFTDSMIREEMSSLEAKIKENSTIKILKRFSQELATFKQDFDLKPIMEMIRAMEKETLANQKATLAEFKTSLEAKIQNIPRTATFDPASLQKEIETLRMQFLARQDFDAAPLQQELASLQTNFASLSKEMRDTSKTDAERVLLEEKIDGVKKDVLSRIANLGGGSMNQKVSVNGVVMSKKYADFNLTGGGVSMADNDTTKQVDITFTSSGGTGSPGGLNTQIQYNNSGSFGGISGAVTDGTAVSLTAPHLLNPTINGAGTGLATLVYPNTSSSASITVPATTGTLALTSQLTAGTVSDVSSADANATVANPTTTPVITIVSAPKLTTPRTIAGTSFDGTANIKIGALNSTNVGATTSLELIGVISDETGSGALVFGTAPTVALASASTAVTQTPGDGSTKVATTAYVDAAINGTDAKDACKYGTTAALPTVVYSNGASGVGATLIAVGLGALSLDGNTPAVNDRVLVKNQVSTFQNGIYNVTTVGNAGVAFVLTRTTDFDQSADIDIGDSVFVTSGTVNASTTWVQNGTNSPTMGTDPITFSQIAGPGAITSGNGITVTGLSVAIDTSITVDKTTSQTLTNKTLTAPVMTAPVLGTPASGVATNLTGLPAAAVLAGSLGTGAYVMDTKLTVPQVINTVNNITATSNAATIPATFAVNQVTNNSAATLTITLPTTGMINGQMFRVLILDASAVAQSITWVNGEASLQALPTSTNGSTTLPLTVGFQYNSATSKCRCIAVA